MVRSAWGPPREPALYLREHRWGTSTARQLTARALICSTMARGAPSRSRANPAPNSIDHHIRLIEKCRIEGANRARPSRGIDRGITFRSAVSQQGQLHLTPALCQQTCGHKPSPPLFPGPHNTSTRPSGQRTEIASATAAPERSIRSRLETPRSTAPASARYIWETVTIAGVIDPVGRHSLQSKQTIPSQRCARK